jgi:hypothetical protein
MKSNVSKQCHYLWLYSPLLGRGRFFSFLIFYTVGRTPWTGISPSQGLYLHTEQHKHRINAHTHTSVPQMGSALTIPMFERAKAQRTTQLKPETNNGNISKKTKVVPATHCHNRMLRNSYAS